MIRCIFSLVLVTLVSHCAFSKPSPQVNTILFGSCGLQDKDMPILSSIVKEPGDLFIFLGDNVYGDTEDMGILSGKYKKLGEKPLFKQLRASMPTIAIWDDHDYGENDAGARG